MTLEASLCAMCMQTDHAESLGKYITDTSQISGLLAKIDFAVP